jgi:hypothetical protein
VGFSFALQEAAMRESRRRFVMALVVVAGCSASLDPFLLAQRRGGFPDPPEPAEKTNPAAAQSAASRQSAKNALQQNEREFRAGIERLYQLSSELREEVQKTPTTDVLSVRMYKKTEEIEKLAKQLKSKAKV